MHTRISVHPLPASQNRLSTDELSDHGCQDHPLNKHNRVNQPGHRVFSDAITRLDDRSIAEFENLTLSPPDLEEPEVHGPDLLESYEVITEYPCIDSVPPSRFRSVGVRQRLLVPEQVWKQKAKQNAPEAWGEPFRPAEEPEVLAKQTEGQKKPENLQVIDVLTGMPTVELENKVWRFLTVAVGILSPAGSKVKGAATLVVSEERLERLETRLKGVVKDQVHYEVNENMGRRMLQLAQACGSASPSLSALKLLGFAIPGYRLIPAMLALWRIKDFKDEIAALYFDHNAMPAVTDFAMSWTPTLLSSLF
ncbi:hypothetical protein [Endozoicomonas sp. 4G]|uniref:hypothetical protein n=1 Tax=Endozoicomonas sp. 4G TaxID=2872754 RepID=UPI002078DB00|nr:hypothetical protein [Endozoicomonas sp. 4G]